MTQHSFEFMHRMVACERAPPWRCELKPGDIIRRPDHDERFVVTAIYGERVIAVQTVDIVNPRDWERV